MQLLQAADGARTNSACVAATTMLGAAPCVQPTAAFNRRFGGDHVIDDHHRAATHVARGV